MVVIVQFHIHSMIHRQMDINVKDNYLFDYPVCTSC